MPVRNELCVEVWIDSKGDVCGAMLCNKVCRVVTWTGDERTVPVDVVWCVENSCEMNAGDV